jgi:hypothetical protein
MSRACPETNPPSSCQKLCDAPSASLSRCAILATLGLASELGACEVARNGATTAPVLESKVDENGRTSRPGVFAVGNASNPITSWKWNWEDQTMEIKDRVFIVTGASSGIGLSTAIALSDRGAKVALLARSTDALKELAHKLPGSLPFTVDMTQFD